MCGPHAEAILHEVKRKIIIGYDDSPNSADALELGKQLCEVLAADAVVACSLPLPRYLLGDEMLEAAVREDTEMLFEKAREEFSGLEVRMEAVIDSSPARALFELADAEKPLLMVVGSSHRGSVGRVLLGSVGQRLVEGLPCGLAVAPHGYATGRATHLLRIGAAVDGSDESMAALRTAIGLAERLHARLRVFSVQTLPTYTCSGAPGVALVDLERAMEREAAGVLTAAIEAVPSGLPVDGVKPKGDPADCLERASENLDLLVMGSRSYGPLRRVLLGSVSANLMRTARCPLLVVPRAAGDDPLGFESLRTAGSLVTW